MSDLIHCGLLAVAFGLLFVLAEWLHRTQRVPAEGSRKLVHIGTGLLTLLFPLMLRSLAAVGILCGSFFGILGLSMRHNKLPSINGISRKSWGSLLYPVIVFSVFAFYTFYPAGGRRLFHPLYYFFTPILVMALCDPAAALAGMAWRKAHPQVAQGKTIAGSAAFFFCAAIIIISLSVHFRHAAIPLQVNMATGMLLAVIATLAERFGSRGWDNFTIPASLVAGICIAENSLKTFAG